MCQNYVSKESFKILEDLSNVLNGKTSIESRCLFGGYQAKSPARPSVPLALAHYKTCHLVLIGLKSIYIWFTIHYQ